MAIDPATAAKVAMSVATSEKGKNAIGGIIIGAVALLLIIIAIPAYILTHPLDFLGNMFGIGTQEYVAVEGLKSEYDGLISANNDPVTKIGKFPLPLKGTVTITSHFGERNDPITGEPSFHYGIDLAGPTHCHIISIAKGIVVFAGMSDGLNLVKIQHTDEDGKVFYSRYLHLQKIFVKAGQTVYAEQVIGLQGGDPKTDVGAGTSTGAHLHFEMRDENDAAWDPWEDLFGEEKG